METKTRYLLPTLDAEAFRKDLVAAAAAVGEPTMEDANHLQWLVNMVNGMSVGGPVILFSTLWYRYILGGQHVSFCYLGYAVSAILISTARCMAWTIVGHHVMHGGFSSLAKKGDIDQKWKRGVFAMGARRCLDWLDWMLPEAWNLEHNKLHHYQLSEEGDPDVVEENFETLRQMNLPQAVKLASMIIWMFTWKYTYYSPNTLKQLRLSQPDSFVARNWPAKESTTGALVFFRFLPSAYSAARDGNFKDAWFWIMFGLDWLLLITPMLINVLAPWLLLKTCSIFGWWPETAIYSIDDAASTTLLVCIAAEVLTNLHSFVIIACNHAGKDLWRFSTSCKASSAEFYLRCSYAGVNFETGNDFVDVLYGWLNYQIEHHMFPDMTPLQYRKMQPLVKEVCKKHGVQYIQQNALLRTWRTLLCCTGAETMGRCTAVIAPKD